MGRSDIRSSFEERFCPLYRVNQDSTLELCQCQPKSLDNQEYVCAHYGIVNTYTLDLQDAF
jgi:hypothetical protein